MTRSSLLSYTCLGLATLNSALLAQTIQGPAPAPRVAGPAAPQAPAGPARQITPIVEPAGQPLGPAVQPQIAPIPRQPEWVAQMSPAEQKWIDDVLGFWESSSEKIKLFECKFNRWDYDGGFVANGKMQPRTFAEGTIKYAQPDKGLYHVEKLILNQPGAPGQPPQQVMQNPELGEHWVCNGEKIFSFEANKKQVTMTTLPANMRGKAIADGPLPFMFGAKAETIKARYWIHGLQGAAEGKYWLEAVPKSREDAQNFKQVRIILDQTDYLPESLEIFAPNYNPPQNDSRQTYQFVNRKKEDAANLAKQVAQGLNPLKLFERDFYDVRPPAGWKLVDQDGPGNIPAGPPPQQARPAAPQGQPKTR
jgi:TIGR03009 family protein